VYALYGMPFTVHAPILCACVYLCEYMWHVCVYLCHFTYRLMCVCTGVNTHMYECVLTHTHAFCRYICKIGCRRALGRTCRPMHKSTGNLLLHHRNYRNTTCSPMYAFTYPWIHIDAYRHAHMYAPLLQHPLQHLWGICVFICNGVCGYI